MHTPNIDSIAEKGIIFENCFCNSPVCVPSRTSILTGLYPEDTAVYHNEACLPTFKLPRNVVTFPELLREAGYATANFGKTHIPQQIQPFDTDVKTGSEMSMGLTMEERRNLDFVAPGGRPSMNIGSVYPADRPYYPESVTRNAIEWMAGAEKPYFVRISYLQPHTPVIVKKGYETLYENYPFSWEMPDISGLSEFEKAFASCVCMKEMDPENMRRAIVFYYGMVAWLDGEIGKILSFLQKNRMEDTILIFGADHGAVRGESGAAAGKHIFTRASHAVPLIIAGPGIPRGKREGGLCSNIDLAKTLFGILGLKLSNQFRGHDLLKDGCPDMVYSTIGYGESHSFAFPNNRYGKMPNGRGWPRRSCVRKGNFRLDMNVRIDGRLPREEEEDLFFTDTSVWPAEDKNMASDPRFARHVTELRKLVLEHGRGCLEVPSECVCMSENI